MWQSSGVILPVPVSVDEEMMGRALRLASRAAQRGEVPVGALVTHHGEVVASASNRRETARDATAHAELLAIRRACHRLAAWRLTGTTLYVTLEPCAMCAGALVLARVRRLVYGAPDPKAGAAGSVFDVVRERRLNHRIDVTGGVRADDCAALLSRFFKERRGRDGRVVEGT
jgi:tRNA(adenine34) deaminase